MLSDSSGRRHSLENLCGPFSEKESKKVRKEVSSINSALVSYLTSLQAYENKIVFDSDENSTETIKIYS